MRRSAAILVVSTAAALLVGVVPNAMAQTPAAVATVDHVTMLTDRRAAIFVNSPSMGRVMQVEVLLPRDRSVTRPSLYMLDGVNAGSESNYAESAWTQMTDAQSFFEDKDVNVVMPIGGKAAYYADWENADPVLGVNKWETFLTAELPPLIDAQFSGNGTNAIAGVSMGAQGAMNLITKHPDLYAGVAGLSGCYDTSSPRTQATVFATVGREGANPENLFGPPTDPAWAANDPSRNAEALRGKSVYLASGTGVPGPYEIGSDPVKLLFAPLEVVANACTHDFAARLGDLGIAATVNFRPVGTHSWRYWQDDLRGAWPTLAGALGLA